MSTALSKSQEIYENMLKNPENRTSSSGQVKQPSPFEDAEIRGGNIDTSKIEDVVINIDPTPNPNITFPLYSFKILRSVLSEI